MLDMTYSESAQGLRISRQRALRELFDHGNFSPADIDQFFMEVGYRETYDAEEVLAWLGY